MLKYTTIYDAITFLRGKLFSVFFSILKISFFLVLSMVFMTLKRPLNLQN